MSSASTTTPATASSFSNKAGITSTDVGWQFVPQYYTFVNKHPQRLHCFYTKNSTFIHGTEGEDGVPCTGQQEIHQKILSIGFQDCKVYIHSVDSQPSAGGGIMIQVIGEMSNNSGPWKKFAQSFFLAEQPNGYFVLNDIFRFLKEDTAADEEESTAEEPAAAAAADSAAADVPVAAAAPAVESAEVVSVAPQAAAPETPAVAPAAAVPEEKKDISVPEIHSNGQIEVKDEVATPAAAAPAAAVEEKAAPVAEEKKAPAATATEEKAAIPSPAAQGKKVAAPAPAAPAAAEKPKAAAPAAAPAAPAKPAAPAAPKTWASLAKSSAGGWGKNLAAGAQGVSTSTSAPAATAPAAAAAPAKDASAAAPKEKDAAATNNGKASGKSHPAYEAAMNISHAACFVKLANWAADREATVDADALRSVLETRFGRVKELEIVKLKACAFLEFERVDSAKRAIAASLPVAQGGEGGVKVGDQGGRVIIEVRKEKSERGPGGGRGAARAGGAGGRGAAAGGEGAEGGAAPRGGGRGRGEGRGGRGGRGGGGRGGAAAGGASSSSAASAAK